MTRFLEQTATYLLKHHPDDLDKVCVVLPSRRAGIFLKKYLSQHTAKPIFAPEIYSIEDIVFSLTGSRKIEPAYLFFEFYEVYRGLEGDNAGPFKDFVKWAEVVIQDFNEVDLYLIDPDDLFGYLSDAKAITLWNLDERPLTPFEARYLRFFNSLAELYKGLSKRLTEKKLAYQGLAYRNLAEKLTSHDMELPWNKVLFAGFNALTAAEEKIIRTLLDRRVADLLWDADHYYLDDPVQEAGYFLRRNKTVLGLMDLGETNDHFKSSRKDIHMIGVPGNIGQARVVGELLEEFRKTNPELDNSCLVLNDENLLFPVLNSLPEFVNSFNLTMGLPLKKTILFNLVNDFIQMNENVARFERSSAQSPGFYFKDLLRIVEHPYFDVLTRSEAPVERRPAFQIRSRNQIFYRPGEVPGLLDQADDGVKDMLTILFQPWDTAQKAIDGIIFLLKKLKYKFTENSSEGDKINTEYVFHFSMLFNKLKASVEEFPFLNDLESFRHVFMQMVRSITIPFYGEPLQGIQIMGMLETRTLDFENIVMLSVNEDFIPGKGMANSFIPYEIKRKFSLPTHRERNAVSAYHFYRLLQRAKNVYLVYNTEPGELGGGDRSRFLTQIEYELPGYNPEVRLTSELLSVSPDTRHADDSIRIPKTREISEILNRRAKRGFSASALNAYRNCSLKFYFKYILGIDEAEEVEETIEASTLGSVVHDVLQQLYEPFKGKVLIEEDMKAMRTRAEALLRQAFRKNFPKGDITGGKNLLVSKVAESFINRFLLSEEEAIKHVHGNGSNIVVEELEREVVTGIDRDGYPGDGISFKGVIDRIDRTDGATRIIDYKTGRVDKAELRLKSWDDLQLPLKFDKLFQLLFYAYLYTRHEPLKTNDIEAVIYSFRNLSQGFLSIQLPEGKRLINGLSEFEEYLKELLHQIYDKDLPFEQSTDTKVCEYCTFKSICHR